MPERDTLARMVKWKWHEAKSLFLALMACHNTCHIVIQTKYLISYSTCSLKRNRLTLAAYLKTQKKITLFRPISNLAPN